MGDLFSLARFACRHGERVAVPRPAPFFFWPPRPRMRPAASTEDGRLTAASQRLYPNFPRPGNYGSARTRRVTFNRIDANKVAGRPGTNSGTGADKALSLAGRRKDATTNDFAAFPLPAAAPETGNSPNHAVPQLLRERERGVAAID
jgi:hypothetical protein